MAQISSGWQLPTPFRQQQFFLSLVVSQRLWVVSQFFLGLLHYLPQDQPSVGLLRAWICSLQDEVSLCVHVLLNTTGKLWVLWFSGAGAWRRRLPVRHGNYILGPSSSPRTRKVHGNNCIVRFRCFLADIRGLYWYYKGLGACLVGWLYLSTTSHCLTTWLQCCWTTNWRLFSTIRQLEMVVLPQYSNLRRRFSPCIFVSQCFHTTWRPQKLANLNGLVVSIFQIIASSRIRLSQYSGLLLITSGTISISIALAWGGAQFPWRSVHVLVPICVGATAYLAFFIWEFTWAKSPTVCHIRFSVECMN